MVGLDPESPCQEYSRNRGAALMITAAFAFELARLAQSGTPAKLLHLADQY